MFNHYPIEMSSEGSTGFDTLLTKPITKSSAMQRTGRAGREVCSLLRCKTGGVNYQLSGNGHMFSTVHGRRFQSHETCTRARDNAL
jgi:hypothetical protein